ncbi:MAG: DUF2442 domain-containing protein [Acidobacteria bacterium]|nr:MAG: DUF2442 domain-containing protein [Acidobacteriota bacterium]
MSSSAAEAREALATAVSVTADTLSVDLSDGRTVAVPLSWFPRLVHGTRAERDDWSLVGGGLGIHWPALDEDVSVEGLLVGRMSGESPQSLERWLQQRRVAG